MDYVDPQLTPHLMPTPYISRRRLLEKLRKKFGPDKFDVQVRFSAKKFATTAR